MSKPEQTPADSPQEAWDEARSTIALALDYPGDWQRTRDLPAAFDTLSALSVPRGPAAVSGRVVAIRAATALACRPLIEATAMGMPPAPAQLHRSYSWLGKAVEQWLLPTGGFTDPEAFQENQAMNMLFTATLLASLKDATVYPLPSLSSADPYLLQRHSMSIVVDGQRQMLQPNNVNNNQYIRISEIDGLSSLHVDISKLLWLSIDPVKEGKPLRVTQYGMVCAPNRADMSHVCVNV